MLLRKGISVSSPPSLKALVFVVVVAAVVGSEICGAQNISRASFPKGFVFGTASSAYQFEGAVKEDGRGATIWDTISHTSGKIADSSNGDIAVDQYHRYVEDVELMKDMGMDAYRFSIAWSRIFPNGAGEVNQAGIDHYNKLINALLAKGIEPYVTLYHWDLPQALEDRCNAPLLSHSKDGLHDVKRMKYHNDYLTNLLAAIKEDGCNVKGYFAWSLLDNWEWIAGFSSRFGLYYVDYDDNLKRIPKDSVRWFKNFLASNP